VQPRLHSSPDRAIISGVAPRGAHLRGASLVAHVQVAEDEREYLRVEAGHVSAGGGLAVRRRLAALVHLRVQLMPRRDAAALADGVGRQVA